MTKKKLSILLLLLLVVLAVITYFLLSNKKADDTPPRDQAPPIDSSRPPQQPVLKLNGRRVMNLPAQDPKALKDLQIANKVTETWKKNTEKALRVQGGNALKEIEIVKAESLIWVQHGLALNVESVKIGLVNNKGETTRFDALVDSQTGKIIQTFNHPVIDPANPREQFRIKVDPRYLTE